jgi:hypothetical protein
VNRRSFIGLAAAAAMGTALMPEGLLNPLPVYGVSPVEPLYQSIWFVSWGPDAHHHIYPKSSMAGLNPTWMVIDEASSVPEDLYERVLDKQGASMIP